MPLICTNLDNFPTGYVGQSAHFPDRMTTVLSLVVGLAHMTQGNVDFSLAGTLLLGSIPGVLVGSRLAPWVPGKPLKAILAGMLVFVGVRLLLT